MLQYKNARHANHFLRMNNILLSKENIYLNSADLVCNLGGNSESQLTIS